MRADAGRDANREKLYRRTFVDSCQEAGPTLVSPKRERGRYYPGSGLMHASATDARRVPYKPRSRFGLTSRGDANQRNHSVLTDEDLPDGSFAHSSNQLTRVNVG